MQFFIFHQTLPNPHSETNSIFGLLDRVWNAILGDFRGEVSGATARYSTDFWSAHFHDYIQHKNQFKKSYTVFIKSKWNAWKVDYNIWLVNNSYYVKCSCFCIQIHSINVKCNGNFYGIIYLHTKFFHYIFHTILNKLSVFKIRFLDDIFLLKRWKLQGWKIHDWRAIIHFHVFLIIFLD